ncbi:hypothetical protein RFI_05807 [Reticulomyxa filosa]|uniref:Uncharacterized protein n=1 Tax=Reticulomyxa filosa TaxID=46433 RepID=X6NZK2_RETFI|nr:hypothetical protein RFI_05807 [Reticulomyxa filosa]|eukprot:ETO31313.1 hypothetical protein RFI_05807 [Reticulomyxa filosa]
MWKEILTNIPLQTQVYAIGRFKDIEETITTLVRSGSFFLSSCDCFATSPKMNENFKFSTLFITLLIALIPFFILDKLKTQDGNEVSRKRDVNYTRKHKSLKRLGTTYDVPKSGPIDISELANEVDQTQLKKMTNEHLTHEWLHEDQLMLLELWYRFGKAFPRKVYGAGLLTARNRDLHTFYLFCYAQELIEKKINKTQKNVMLFDDENVVKVLGTENADNEIISEHLWLPFEYDKRISCDNRKGIIGRRKI